MKVRFPTRLFARRLPPGWQASLLPLLLILVAACGPGNGGGPAY
jgi:hypothetical protein